LDQFDGEEIMIYLASDHAGFKLKEEIKQLLESLKEEFLDMGTNSEEAVDYPDFIFPAVEKAIAEGTRAIVFGGTGMGECVAANKVKGAIAATPFDEFTTVMSREHNDSNVLCLGGRSLTVENAKSIVELWLGTPFSEEERHVRRLEKITKYESSE
jgi:ribose 5-phosphate isomerase B